MLIKFHGGIIFLFFVLNIYLHCGYTFEMIENILPKLFINTSKFHNLHHEKVHYNFGEMLCLWDYLRNTGATLYNKKEFKNSKYFIKFK